MFNLFHHDLSQMEHEQIGDVLKHKDEVIKLINEVYQLLELVSGKGITPDKLKEYEKMFKQRLQVLYTMLKTEEHEIKQSLTEEEKREKKPMTYSDVIMKNGKYTLNRDSAFVDCGILNCGFYSNDPIVIKFECALKQVTINAPKATVIFEGIMVGVNVAAKEIALEAVAKDSKFKAHKIHKNGTNVHSGCEFNQI